MRRRIGRVISFLMIVVLITVGMPYPKEVFAEISGDVQEGAQGDEENINSMDEIPNAVSEESADNNNEISVIPSEEPSEMPSKKSTDDLTDEPENGDELSEELDFLDNEEYPDIAPMPMPEDTDKDVVISIYTLSDNNPFEVTETYEIEKGSSLADYEYILPSVNDVSFIGEIQDDFLTFDYFYYTNNNGDSVQFTEETIVEEDLDVYADYVIRTVRKKFDTDVDVASLSDEEQYNYGYSYAISHTFSELKELFFDGEKPAGVFGYLDGIKDSMGSGYEDIWLPVFLGNTIYDFLDKNDLNNLRRENISFDDLFNVLVEGDEKDLLGSYDFIRDIKERYEEKKTEGESDTEAEMAAAVPCPLLDVCLSEDFANGNIRILGGADGGPLEIYNITTRIIYPDFYYNGTMFGKGYRGKTSHGAIYRSSGWYTLNGGSKEIPLFCGAYGYPIRTGYSYDTKKSASEVWDSSIVTRLGKLYTRFNKEMETARDEGEKKKHYLTVQIIAWLILNNTYSELYMTPNGFYKKYYECIDYRLYTETTSATNTEGYTKVFNNYFKNYVESIRSDADTDVTPLYVYTSGTYPNQLLWGGDLIEMPPPTPPITNPPTPTPTGTPEEIPYYMQLRIVKKDNDTGRVIKHHTEFTIYEYDTSSGEYEESDKYQFYFDGERYLSDYLLYTEDNQGRFGVKETERPYDSIFSGYIPDERSFYIVMEPSLNPATDYIKVEGDSVMDASAGRYVETVEGSSTDIPVVTLNNTGYSVDPFFYNTASRGKITFNKRELESGTLSTQGDISSLNGARYSLYAAEDIYYPDGQQLLYSKDEKIETKTITDGSLTFDNYYLGEYYVKEDVAYTTADGKKMSYVEGYLADDNEYNIHLNYDYADPAKTVSASGTSYNEIVKAKFSFQKLSADEESASWLSDAGFTVFRIRALSKYNSSWLNADGTFNSAEILRAYLNENANKIKIGGVYYYSDVYDFSGEEEAVATMYARDVDSTQSAISGLARYYYNEAQADVAAGRLSYEGGNLYRVNELFSNEKGIVECPYLPYGDYLVVETTTPKDHEQAKPFVVALYDGDTQISEGITENIPYGRSITESYDYFTQDVSTTKPYASWYRGLSDYYVLDNVMTQLLKIYKFDADTKKDVLAPGAEFKLYGRNALKLKNGSNVASETDFNTFVSEKGISNFSSDKSLYYETAKNGERITYEIRVVDGLYYKYKKVITLNTGEQFDSYTTNVTSDGEDCYVCVPKDLPVGEYVLEELAAPKGYYNDMGYYLVFKVTSDREYRFIGFGDGGAQNFLITEHYNDDETRGRLSIYKKGEALVSTVQTNVEDNKLLESLDMLSAKTTEFVYEERYLGGAEYTIYAEEDIYTPDFQYEKNPDGTYVLDSSGQRVRTTWFKKGDKVCVARTGEPGQNTEKAVIYDGSEARCETGFDLSGHLTSIDYYGYSSGTYDSFVSGHPIVKIYTDTEGKVTVDLPLGMYRVKETKAPVGYTLCNEDYLITFSWERQEDKYVYNSEPSQVCQDIIYDKERLSESGSYSEEGLVFTNKRMKASLTVNKEDMASGEPLSGLTFALLSTSPIYDYHGDILLNASETNPILIDFGVSDENGKVVFDCDMPIGIYTEKTGEFIPRGSNTKTILGGAEKELLNTGFTLYEGYQKFRENSGNYVIAECYTPYGIYLSDDSYGVSYHAYYDYSLSYLSSFAGDNERIAMSEKLSDDVLVANDTTDVSFVKKSGIDASILSGAVLQIIDCEDNTIVRKWISSNSYHLVRALKYNDSLPLYKQMKGTYKLHESAAPSGYDVANDIYFCLVRTPVYDSEGNPAFDSDGKPIFDGHKNDVYFWAEEYVDSEVSTIIASGEEAEYLWFINEYGCLYIKLKPGITSLDFPARTYHPETIDGVTVDVPDILMPWEKDIYDAHGVLIPIDLKSFFFDKDEEDKITYADGYFDKLTKADAFKDKKVIKVISREGWQKADGNLITMYDYGFVPKTDAPPETPPTPPEPKEPPTVVKVSKKLANGSNEFPGCTLSVTDENGKVIDMWVTGTEPYYLNNLEPGKAYVLKELKAPTGYTVSLDIPFVVEKGEFKSITVVDDYTRLLVKKVNPEGKLLGGAQMALYNENGEEMLRWESGSEEGQSFVGILMGGETYTVTEKEAPAGYRLANDIEVVVNATDVTYDVSMVDGHTAVTGDDTVILPYILGLLVILFGTGTTLIVITRKKRKIK